MIISHLDCSRPLGRDAAEDFNTEMHTFADAIRSGAVPGTGVLASRTEADCTGDGDAWRKRAAELAAWIQPFVVRQDCHGGHTVCIDEDGRPEFGRTTLKSPLTLEALERHFAAQDYQDVRGLHVTSSDEQGVLVVVDIDAHGDPGDEPEKNWAFARHVYEEARRLGFVALLLDSNGRGGFHVWVFLGQMNPMAQAWRLGKYLVRDHEAFGLSKMPETFPKSPYLTGKRFGNWVRIMGRHHRRAFWTRVWDEQRERWEEGEAAVELILGTKPMPMDVVTALPADFTAEPPRAGLAEGVPARQPLNYGHRRNVRLAGEALRHLTGKEVDSYDDWLEIGMCLQSLGEDGFERWDTWSLQSTKYRPGKTREKWGSFQAGPGTVGLGTLFRRAEAYGFKGHFATRRWEEYQTRGPGILDPGENPERLADEARDQRFSFICDEAVALLEARPDLRAELAAAWGVSEQTTRLIGAGLREDLERWLDRYMPTGRWAITVPLSAGGLTVGYVRLYPSEAWKSRLAWGSRPGLVLPWETRPGPIVVCGDPADTARALELGACAIGLAEPASPLDELVSVVGDDRDVVVAPGTGNWADDTAYRLGQLTGQPVKVLALTDGVSSLRDCVNSNDTTSERR
jgi:hypothetical protein